MSYMPWVIAGLFCVLLELVLIGGVAGALGISFLLIGGLIGLGWIEELHRAMLLWVGISLALLLALRPLMRRLYPSQTSHGDVNEDETLRGSLVPVSEDIAPGMTGRVHIRGTSWLARFQEPTQSAKAGTSVRLMTRENIIWFVEHDKPNIKDPS